MKKLILILTLFISSICYSQSKRFEIDSMYHYPDIENLDSATLTLLDAEVLFYQKLNIIKVINKKRKDTICFHIIQYVLRKNYDDSYVDLYDVEGCENNPIKIKGSFTILYNLKNEEDSFGFNDGESLLILTIRKKQKEL